MEMLQEDGKTPYSHLKRALSSYHSLARVRRKNTAHTHTHIMIEKKNRKKAHENLKTLKIHVSKVVAQVCICNGNKNEFTR